MNIQEDMILKATDITQLSDFNICLRILNLETCIVREQSQLQVLEILKRNNISRKIQQNICKEIVKAFEPLVDKIVQFDDEYLRKE